MIDLVPPLVAGIQHTVIIGKIGKCKDSVVCRLGQRLFRTRFDIDLLRIENSRFLAADDDFTFIRGKGTARNLDDVHELANGIALYRCFCGGFAASQHQATGDPDQSLTKRKIFHM